MSIPKWAEKIDFKGDFRLRYQYEDTDNDNNPSRSRGRYRLRAGVVADIHDQWKAGFGITSGGANPRSTLQSFDNGFETPDLRLDYAFASYMPFKFASITGGKFKNPIWQPTVFLWDSDIRPEGIAVQFKYKLDQGEGVEFFATPAFFVLDEFNATTKDPVMWLLQAGAKWNITHGIYLKGAGAYDEGWLAGFKFGHRKLDRFGTWLFGYSYRRLERDAWPDFLPHSSFYNGSTNAKGHEFVMKFGIHKDIDLTVDYFRAEQIRLNADNLDREQDWLAVDLNLKW
jgi:hypothetical protein